MSVTMRRNFIYQLGKCNYATESALKAASTGENNIKTGILKKNNIPLLSINEDYPYSRVTVAFRSGSRYEKDDNVGISNIIRSSVGLGTKQFTKFGITRNLDIKGVSLYASNDREIFSYTLEGPRENIAPLLVYLASVSTSPDFKPWELAENIYRIKLEHSTIPNEAKTIDLLHKAAYKTGLGNSLFTPEYKLSYFTQENLSEYYEATFTGSRALVAGSGIEYNLLTEFGNFLELPSGNVLQPETAKFYGGEERLGLITPITHVAVAAEASGFTKKEAAAYGVLSYIYGSKAPLKYSQPKGIISEVVSKFTDAFSVSNVNISYPDSGLIGFLLSAPSDKIGQAYPAALSEFLKGTIDDKDVAKAKANLKAELSFGVEDNNGLLNFLINQLGHNTVLTPSKAVAAIDAVTAADVKQAAKKISTGNVAVSVVGNIDHVPYLSSLK